MKLADELEERREAIANSLEDAYLRVEALRAELDDLDRAIAALEPADAPRSAAGGQGEDSLQEATDQPEQSQSETADETPEPVATLPEEGEDRFHQDGEYVGRTVDLRQPAPSEQPQGPSPVEDEWDGWKPYPEGRDLPFERNGCWLEERFDHKAYRWMYRYGAADASVTDADPAKPAPVNSTSAETETVQGEQPNPEPVGEDA